MYYGASENDPLLKATTIKYEQRYAHQKLALRRSMIAFLVTLGLVLIFDISRIIIRRDRYDPGNGNMVPQAIMVVFLGIFLVVFRNREKTTLLMVVYITVLVLFFLFSLAIIPSFIKEIIIDFDVLAPVLISLTGINALFCIYCISTAYRFLKFHRKYTKRKATLPAAVLHSSPKWQPKQQQPPEDEFVKVLFPEQQLDPKTIQEQWEKFQQSRLYLPENKPAPHAPRRPALPSSTTGPPPTAPAPGQLTAQERWERFQRSPIFSVNNNGEAAAAPPQIGRARRHTFKERSGRPSPAPSNTLNVSTSTLPPPPPPPTPAEVPMPTAPPPEVQPTPHASYSSMTQLSQSSLVPAPQPAVLATQQHSTQAHVAQPTQEKVRARLDRNPSFRYGAYVHEPTPQYRAHPDATPEEYTRLSQLNRGESLPILDGSSSNLVPPSLPVGPPPLELESLGNPSDDESESDSRRAITEEMKRERRRSLPQRGSGNFAHLRVNADAGDAQRSDHRFESFASHFAPNTTYSDSPRADTMPPPHLVPKMDKITE